MSPEELPAHPGYIKRRRARVIRYVNYSSKHHPELHARELYMLFVPWRNELSMLPSNMSSWQDCCKAKQKLIDDGCQRYQALRFDRECMMAAEEGDIDMYDQDSE